MKKNCLHCGAKMVEYKHSLNQGLVQALAKLVMNQYPSALKDLDLTVNQFNNFQKLQYWGLVRKDSENLWEYTSRAERFFEGLKIPKSVWTYRGKFVRWGSELVDVHNLIPNYKIKADYVKESRPVK